MTSADRAQSVVAFGGGHGLHASLTALRLLQDELTVDQLTAVVTVADNGGSSGRLREQFDVLPPGDLRMALAALCGDDDWGGTWARVMQHRFSGDGDMKGHVIGNLLIVGLWELLGDHVDALDRVGRLLGAKGRVLPMALVPMDIRAEVRGAGDDPDALTTVRGQVEVATTDGVITAIALEPPDPPVSPAALSAIAEADWVVLGPGSWFSSVIPHLLVPAIRDALVRTDARRIVVLNLGVHDDDETGGFGPADHLSVLLEHAPDLHVHHVLADARDLDETHAEELRQVVEASGAELVLDDVMADGDTPRHDPKKLAAAYARIIERASVVAQQHPAEGR